MNKEPQKIKFAVDSMLGSLATWLRLLGYDTFYRPHIKKEHLLNIAASEKRIMLTRRRNLNLYARRQPIIVLTKNHVSDLLCELNCSVPLHAKYAHTRCSRCNRKLASVDKKRVASLVPSSVLESHETFSQCIHCGKIYWAGSHKKNMAFFLKKIGIIMMIF